MKTIELLGRLETEKDDEKWMKYWEKLMERSPFQGITDLIDDVNARTDALEQELKELKMLFRLHKHYDNKIMKEI